MRWLVSGALVLAAVAAWSVGMLGHAQDGPGAPLPASIDGPLAPVGASPPDGAPSLAELDLYAFGDSLVVARQVRPGESFVERYAADAGRSAARNQDGSGKGTLWALDRIDRVAAAHEGEALLLLFGHNDPRPARGALPPEQTAENLVELASRASAAGAEPVVGNLVLVRPGCAAAPYDTSLEAQRRRIETIHASLEARGIHEVPFWDALDEVPFDGTLQGWNRDLYVDCIHPNAAGHANMAKLLLRAIGSG